MRRACLSPLAAFLRHRYRAHVRGWLIAAVGVLTVAYVGTLPNEPWWLAWPASFLSALFVVSLGVLAAALLRLPWWLLAPWTLVSMAVEWTLRQLVHRPWQRRPQPRERWLGNPFAWWQRRRLRKLRRRSQPPPAAATSRCRPSCASGACRRSRRYARSRLGAARDTPSASIRTANGTTRRSCSSGSILSKRLVRFRAGFRSTGRAACSSRLGRGWPAPAPAAR